MSTISGGCHCGAIRYQVEGDAIVHALCHCRDCRLHAGAPVVGWAMYAENALKVSRGQPKIYNSSEHGRRHFCGKCGTGLFYVNADMLPAIVDIQSATYDNPDAVPPRCRRACRNRSGVARPCPRRRRRGRATP